MKYWYESKFAIYTFVLSIITLVIVTAIFYKIDYDNKPVAKENEIVPYLYNFYTSKNPGTLNSLFYGNEDASITMMAFLDFNSAASKNFIKNLFPRIKADYIDKGNLRYYYKSYITLEDIEEKSNNYRYSLALLCVSKLNKEDYFNFYFDLFFTNTSKIPDLIKKYGMPKNEFDGCLKNEDNVQQLYKNALEIEGLGIIGVNQRFYIGISGKDNTVLTGIQKYSKFQDAIRQYEVRIGN